MRYEIVLAPEAVKDLDRLPANVRAKLRDGLQTYLRHQPEKPSRSRIKRLRKLSQPQYRLRVDDVRIFYDVIDNRVEVLAIVPKTEAATWLGQFGKVE